jgi:hypothetical protein
MHLAMIPDAVRDSGFSIDFAQRYYRDGTWRFILGLGNAGFLNETRVALDRVSVVATMRQSPCG